VTETSTAHTQTIECDICIVGGGSAGLSVAAAAAQLGARTVLIERGAMGGDCLNTGCVPSKSLIAAAHQAHAASAGAKFGVDFSPPKIDFGRVSRHIHGVIAAIAPHDSVERFEGLGVQVLRETARFEGPDTIAAGAFRIRARRFVVATGSRAALPPVEGLAAAEPLTNETVFELTELPAHLVIVGGGPIGLELAQAFRRLGSQVSVLERATILPRDEPEAAAIARAVLRDEGVALFENADIAAVRRLEGSVEVAFAADGQQRTVTGSHILVAAGRTPNVEDLGLEAAGVRYGPRGIEVDARLRSSNRRIFAIGDVAGGPQFTHIAGYHAGIVVRNALFWLPAKVDYRALPWVTYLDPEIAHVGLTEAEARRKVGTVETPTVGYDGNDRAQAERRTEGFIKLVLGRRGKVLGVTIVGPHAGEAIGLWCLVVARRLPLSAVAGMIAPYPTLSEISKRVAGNHYAPRLFSDRVRAVVRFVQRWTP
jgi:pyruvate/2-oxoglutarate dehydrogenase complex dihydrolipoamide dehydrogenase (E3) component